MINKVVNKILNIFNIFQKKVLFKSKITTKQTKGIESYPQNHIC